MGREGPIGWREGEGMGREGGGMAHSLPFALLEREIAAFCLPFGWLEGRGMRLEEEGTGRGEVFAGHEASFEWEEAGGMRLAELVTRRRRPARPTGGDETVTIPSPASHL